MATSHSSPPTCSGCQRALTPKNAFAANEKLYCVRCAPPDAVPGWYQIALAERGPEQFAQIRWPSLLERFRDLLQKPHWLVPIAWFAAVIVSVVLYLFRAPIRDLIRLSP